MLPANLPSMMPILTWIVTPHCRLQQLMTRQRRGMDMIKDCLPPVEARLKCTDTEVKREPQIAEPAETATSTLLEFAYHRRPIHELPELGSEVLSKVMLEANSDWQGFEMEQPDQFQELARRSM